jgi:(p)ppGpp synthase/HD superfamily hydrolase
MGSGAGAAVEWGMASNPGLSLRFDHAVRFAHEIHRYQTKKGSRVPYIAHVLGVTAIVLEYGGTEDQAIAALLHDALEDADPEPWPTSALEKQIETRFGPDVLAIVRDCTDTTERPKPNWLSRKLQYVQHVAKAPEASLLVSAADKLYNVRAIARDYDLVGDEVWSRFKATKPQILGYYRGLADIFVVRLQSTLAADLDMAVSALEETLGQRGLWPPV